MAAVATRDTPVEQLLYKPEIEVGSRGDIIQFYNKLFIGFIKDFVLKFSPNEPEVHVRYMHNSNNTVLAVTCFDGVDNHASVCVWGGGGVGIEFILEGHPFVIECQLGG